MTPEYWQHLVRQDISAISLPKGSVYQVARSSALFQEIGALFYSTCSYTEGYKLEFIQAVNSATKFTMYQAKKQEMSARINDVRERWFWHGTGIDVLPSILLNGFIREYSTAYRQAYGYGTYFAANANYSWKHEYSKPAQVGNKSVKVLLLTRILIGESCIGNPSKQKPDLKKDGYTMYDSMCDSVNKPSIVVLSSGSDSQAFVEFVLYFTK